jgi:hypothetical protein
MEFTIPFLANVIVRLVAWRGSRALTLSLFAVVLIGCVASTLLECGFKACADDPVRYELLTC